MINKKTLIELFETQIDGLNSTYEQEYVKGEYFPCIKFNDEFEKGRNIFKTSYSNCKMYIWREQNTDYFFLSFNSISVKISFTEYVRLKNLYNKRYKSFVKSLKKHEEIKDKKLLDKVFSIKNAKEARKTMIEKVVKSKIFDEDDDVKKAAYEI